MQLKLKVRKTPTEGAIYERNYYGWKTIDVLVFNFDGRGRAIVLHDGELDTCSDDDIMDYIHGGWYEMAQSNVEDTDANRIQSRSSLSVVASDSKRNDNA